MNSLSLRQQRFLTTYAQIGNATEAAARAGYRGTRASLAVQGCRLKKTLRFAKECSETRLFRSPEDLKEAISERLEAVSAATPEKITATHYLKAIELLCKLHGLFDQPVEQTNIQMAYFDVKNANPQELWAKLQEIEAMKKEIPTDQEIQPTDQNDS